MPDLFISPTDDQHPPAQLPKLSDDSYDENEGEISDDPRHQKRIIQMQALFAFSFGNDEAVEPDQLAFLAEIKPELESIDAELKAVAPERPLQEINKVDLAILRLIVFESRHKKTPKKVLIDEAVELAKHFGADGSPAFVNAVLGKVVLSTDPPAQHVSSP